MMITRCVDWVAFCLACLAAAAAMAGPTVASVSPRALQSGGTTLLTIDGANLLPAPRLLVSMPGLKQSLRSGGTAKRVQIEVSLDENIAAGFYQFRIANESGVSPPLVVAVDALPQLPLADSVGSLPVALQSNVTGSMVARTSLEGKAGQRLVADVEARRIGAALNPVVRLYDANLVQLAYAQPTASLAGDARLEAVLPRDGKYTVEVHDALFRGANPGHFRLKLGDLHYADLAYPLGVQQGSKAALGFASSNLPADAKVELEGLILSRSVPVPWPAAERVIGGRPWVVVSRLPEIAEESIASDAALQVPAAINGRLLRTGEEDRYLLTVTPGMKLKIDMLAAQAGSPLDGVLAIRNAQGGQLASSDDRPGTTDPGLDFTVPANVNQIVLAVKDLLGRGGPPFVYRVAVSDASQPDFSLTVQEDRIEIPQRGTTLVRVKSTRSGYNGPIRLALEGLPEGVALSGAEIPAGANDALVSFTASELSPMQALVRLVGQTADGAVERVAEFPETPPTRHQPWLATELAAAVTPPAALEVAWSNVSTEGVLPLAGSVASQVTTVRREGAKGPVRISLISTQTIPKKQVLLQQVDDLDRAVRLDGAITLSADQSESSARVLVPGDLPVQSYDLAIKAELLSADGKTVVATAVSPARRFTPAKPSISLELAGEPAVEARAGSGETGKLVGKIVRSAGFDQPVTITLAGLPKEVAAPKHIVSGERSEFEFPVTFAFGTSAGEVSGVKLVATSQLNEKTMIKAEQEIPLILKIVPGDPLTPVRPLVVFEDESEFVTALSEGNGSVMLATDVKYSGAACVRVKPEQKSQAVIPGLSIKIRQYPGPGEYRYLRFAWRKEGGRAICLQLAHDGKFGPTPGVQGKFRYHAGPGPECFGASVTLNNNIPTEFTVVTRDLFADFGEFTLTGLGLAVFDGNDGLFDHIYVARKPEDFGLVVPKK